MVCAKKMLPTVAGRPKLAQSTYLHTDVISKGGIIKVIFLRPVSADFVHYAKEDAN